MGEKGKKEYERKKGGLKRGKIQLGICRKKESQIYLAYSKKKKTTTTFKPVWLFE